MSFSICIRQLQTMRSSSAQLAPAPTSSFVCAIMHDKVNACSVLYVYMSNYIRLFLTDHRITGEILIKLNSAALGNLVHTCMA